MKIIYNNTELEILETDDSFRYRKLMTKGSLTLYFAGPNFLEIPIGAYVMYEGEKYSLTRSQDFQKVSNKYYNYTLVLYDDADKAYHIKVRNTVDRRLKFSYTAKPHEHLQMIVDNLNERDSGWSIGDCVDMSEVTISYNFTYAIDALSLLADACSTEFDIRTKVISLCKVEYNKDNPLALAYGVGNGFLPDVGRKTSHSTNPPVELLFVQGGEDNIDYSKYGSSELLLPKSQILEYEGREYISDADGYSIRRNDKEIQYNNEDGVDCTTIYPKRVGEITSVVVEDEENNFYDIIDTTIPDNLNYEDYLIDGETMTIIFQSGMLSGREFDVAYFHEATGDKAGKRFEIVPQELDGQTMPNETFRPQPEDTYAVFNCYLPDSYICDNDTQTGASWDMFREAAKYFYENEDPKFTFEGELDGLWSKSRWLEIGGKITIGGYVLFTDEDFQQEGVKIRIIGIKDYVKKPHAPELELSNDVTGISVSSELDKIAAQEVDIIEAKKSAIRYARRGFRDVQETSEMLMDALLNFSGEINPIVVKTMQLIAGDESLQFRFVNNMTTPTTTSHAIVFNSATKIVTSEAGVIQHMTLGVSSISSTHSVSEYKFWNVAQYTSPALTDPDKRYYLYIKASKSDQTATMLLSETAIAIEGVAEYYHFLTGVLNAEYNGDRSYVDMYGFTEILPGRVTADKIISADGTSYFDLVNNIIKMGSAGRFIAPSITFSNSDGTETDLNDTIGSAKRLLTDVSVRMSGMEITTKEDTGGDVDWVEYAGENGELYSTGGVDPAQSAKMRLQIYAATATTLRLYYSIFSGANESYLYFGVPDTNIHLVDSYQHKVSGSFDEGLFPQQVDGVVEYELPPGDHYIDIWFKAANPYSGDANWATIEAMYDALANSDYAKAIKIEGSSLDVFDENGNPTIKISGDAVESVESALGFDEIAEINIDRFNETKTITTSTTGANALSCSEEYIMGSFSIPLTGTHCVTIPSVVLLQSITVNGSVNDASVWAGSASITMFLRNTSTNSVIQVGDKLNVGVTQFFESGAAESYTKTNRAQSFVTGGDYEIGVLFEAEITTWAPTYANGVTLTQSAASAGTATLMTATSRDLGAGVMANAIYLKGGTDQYLAAAIIDGELKFEARSGASTLEMVERYESDDGLNGYDKWSGGRLECWGYISSSAASGEINFPDSVEFANAKYLIQTTICGTNNSIFADIRPHTQTTSGFSYATLAVPENTNSHTHYAAAVNAFVTTSTPMIEITTTDSLPFSWLAKGRWK